jgi:glycosyltransferase involved in cell wall biosynthesis
MTARSDHNVVSVLVDGKALADDSAFSGVGTYVRSLVQGMASRPDVDLGVLAPPAAELPDDVRRAPVRRLAPRRWALREHDLLLPRDIRGAPGEVFHSPGLDPPRQCDRPWVQTLHDVIPLVWQSPALAGPRARLERQRPLFRAADAIIAVSRYSAAEGIRVLGLDPARVHVVHHGVDRSFRPPGEGRTADPPYLAFVSEFSPRKGHAEAFEVAAQIAERGFPHRLKVAGRIHPPTRAALLASASAARRPDRIDLLDYVRNLPVVYQQASVAMVTSRAEGFCFPALEAMACGTPVVAFDNTATAEIVASGGVLVPDGDVDTFAKEVASVLESPPRWQELSERALDRAATFDWDRAVAGHVEIYRSLVRG